MEDPCVFYHITNFKGAECVNSINLLVQKICLLCNCQFIPSAFGNVYLLKAFALSFFDEASKNPDVLSFSAKNCLEFF